MTTLKPRITDRSLAAGLLLTAAVLIGAVRPAGAVPFLDSVYGSQAAFYLPEINGMGGTGTALYHGAISNVFNPALLVREEGQRLDLALSIELETEDRYVPLFDSFDSRVTDTVIASNRHSYFAGGLGYAHRLATGRPVTLALSVTDRYDFQYDFEDELRDPSGFSDPRDRILAERAHRVDGNLWFLSGGAGVSVSRAIALGVAVNYAFGSREQVRTERDFDDPSESLNEKETFDMDGVDFVLGALIHASDRLEIGFSWEPPLIVSGNFLTETTYGVAPDSIHSASGDGRVDYPHIFSGGFTYRPRNAPRTVFTADAVFSKWSDLEDNRLPDGNPRLEDTWDFRVGLQHTFYNKVPVRFGFRQLDSYADREAKSIFFTAGLGMPFAGGLFDFSFELGKIVSDQEHLFAYPVAGFDVTETARVEDTRMRFGVGYRVAW